MFPEQASCQMGNMPAIANIECRQTGSHKRNKELTLGCR